MKTKRKRVLFFLGLVSTCSVVVALALVPKSVYARAGEYTTGYVNGEATQSDKSSGVVGLVFFDLRSRGKVGKQISLCGTSGTKFPALRAHMKKVALTPHTAVLHI